MKQFLTLIASVINQIAIFGGGLPSAGFSFQPKKPENLTTSASNISTLNFTK